MVHRVKWNLAELNIAKMKFGPEGHIPTVAEAQVRLEMLPRDGSSQSAFGFNDIRAIPGVEFLVQ